MRFATFNLRYDSQPDDITVRQSLDELSSSDPLQAPKYLRFSSKEQPWSSRRLRIAAQFLNEEIVLAGFQEALIRQVQDLAELFGEDWAWVGVGRDDGKNRGEFCPIFYNKSKLTLLSTDTFWLSDTPFQPSKYPGASCFRICTVAHFAISAEKSQTCTIMNAHFDDWSDHQRCLAASLILTRARFEASATNSPVIVMGDFNSPPNGADSGAYKIITGLSPLVPIDTAFASKYQVDNHQFPDFHMVDLRKETPRRFVSDNFATFTGFTQPNDPKNWTRIDFMFGGSNKGWISEKYNVATVLYDDGMLSSDHRPVFVDIALK